MSRKLGVVLLVIAHAAAHGQPEATSAASAPSAGSIGYGSVAKALEAVKGRPGATVQITKPDAWTIVNEPGNTQWTFTPSTHPAFPAVVKREIKIRADGSVYVEMSALCQAAKDPCDKLVEDFKQLNEQMRQSIQGRLRQGSGQK